MYVKLACSWCPVHGLHVSNSSLIPVQPPAQCCENTCVCLQSKWLMMDLD